MTQEGGSRPRVLALGAYERDNFGDMLYLELMRIHAGSKLDLEFAAPLPADMVATFGHLIGSAAPLLARGDFDAIWTVGGEVASATLEYAYRTAFGDEALARLMALPSSERRQALRAATGGPLYDSPYIARPSAHGNPAAALVLNSVGLSGLADAVGARRAVLEATIREATFISVRDGRSHRVLDAVGIQHRLEPDLAHTLPLVRPKTQADTRYAVVQLPEFTIREHGVDGWVAALARCDVFAGLPIRLFLAGTAPGHDSVESAGTVRDALSAATGWEVEVSTARGVWPRVDEIAGSALWIGGSLHGRIIAAAYQVPRVSIGSRKVDNYVETWDAGFPGGITPSSLPSAIEFALDGARTRDGASAMAARAMQSVTDAVESVAVSRSGLDPLDRLRHLLANRVAEAEALHVVASDSERSAAAMVAEATMATASELARMSEDRDRSRAHAERMGEDRDPWKVEAARVREDRDRWRAEATGLREDRDRWRAEATGLREDRDRWRAEATGLREDRDRWRARVAALRRLGMSD